jgi:hypothetical protein
MHRGRRIWLDAADGAPREHSLTCSAVLKFLFPCCVVDRRRFDFPPPGFAGGGVGGMPSALNEGQNGFDAVPRPVRGQGIIPEGLNRRVDVLPPLFVGVDRKQTAAGAFAHCEVPADVCRFSFARLSDQWSGGKLCRPQFTTFVRVQRPERCNCGIDLAPRGVVACTLADFHTLKQIGIRRPPLLRPLFTARPSRLRLGQADMRPLSHDAGQYTPGATIKDTANLQSMEKLTVKALAASQNISERTIYYARRLMRSGRDDLVQAVQRGEMTINAALRIIDGPKPIDRYANLVKAWNAASDDDRARFLVAARIPLGEPRQRAT